MAGNLSDSTMSLPANDLPSWRAPSSESDHTSSTAAFNRDRLRLVSEVQRDFNDMSFSDVAPPGAADYTDTTTFDIAADAAATSTRQYDTPPQYNGNTPRPPRRNVFSYAIPQQTPRSRGNMLPKQTPTMNSQVLREQFADFSMAGKGMQTFAETDEDQTDDMPSLEMGRARPKQHGDSLFDNTSEFMSMDRTRQASARQRRAKTQERSFGSPVQKSGFQTLSFDPTTTTPKRTTRSKLSPRGERGEGPSKIMDFVSSQGSGGSRSRFAAQQQQQQKNGGHSEEDALSDVGSVVRPRGSRFQKRQSEPAPEQSKIRKASGNQTVPKSFKSTPDFLKELGLDGHTQTLNLQAELRELKNPGTLRNPKARHASRQAAIARSAPPFEPSFYMPDMTDLFSGNEPTRFSTKRGAAAESHIPIESIPVPIEARAMLTAMRLLQEKVEKLENTKAKNQQKCAKLESELKKAEQRYQQEMRTRLAQVDSRRRRAGADSTFGGSEDGDAEERQKEKARVELMMEKLRLESVIDTLRDDNEKIASELDTAKIALHNIQDERNSAISSVALAISNGEDLKSENKSLARQLEQLRIEKEHAELLGSQQREDFKAREQRLKQRARDAKEAAIVAEEAMKESRRRDSEAKKSSRYEEARKLQEQTAAEADQRQRERQYAREQRRQQEQERIDREEAHLRRQEARREFDEQVERKLRTIRPDLFDNRTSPIKVPHSDLSMMEVSGQQRVIATPRSRTKRVTSPPLEDSDIERELRSKAAELDEDATLTITPEQIQRIAKELSNERKSRRAAEKARAAREAEVAAAAALPLPEDKPNGRRILKVVYLMPDDSEVLELEKDLGEHLGEDINIEDLLGKPAAQPQQQQTVRFDLPSPQHADLPNHDATACTVCHRYSLLRTLSQASTLSNPLAEAPPSTTPLPPAPPLSPPPPSNRPSLPPKTQLERVVRQLKDEFAHLKMLYTQRNEEFLGLGMEERERRKRLVEEMRELVCEMDAKGDQVWGLYDVSEGLRGVEGGRCDKADSPQEMEDREVEGEGEREGERRFDGGGGGVMNMGDETEDLIRSLGVGL